MKTFFRFCTLGLLAAFWPATSHAALGEQKSLLGKFLVSSVNGEVTCVSDGRVFELKKGDTFTARGAVVRTGEKANAILVFSNGTGVYADGGTEFEVLRFEQEFFTPNNNLRVEPSNSTTGVRFKHGRVVISTPRLQSATTMVYETPHAAVGIRGDKVLIETGEKQTHVAMISGNATVNPRNAEGQFISLGKRLVAGQEAFIKYTVASDAPENSAGASGGTAAAAGTSETAATPAQVRAAAVPARFATTETEATLLRVTGTASIKLPGVRESAAQQGAKLPRGAMLSTGGDGRAYLQVFPGTVANLAPDSSVEIGSLSVTTEQGSVTREAALLDLRAGTLVSLIDPSRHAVSEYAVRTPEGTANAHGTAFIASRRGPGFALTSTADRVVFVTRTGARYEIAAGQVSITPPGGQPQPPIPLSGAVANDPLFAGVVRTAFAAVTEIVRDNLGGLSAGAASNLLAQVAATTSAALPGEAPAIVAQAVAAITSPSAATAQQSGPATAAVTQAVVSAAPEHAAAIAVAALTAAQTHDTAVGAAAAKGSPDRATQIGAAVSEALLKLDPQGATPGTLEAIAAVVAAITSANPSHAAPVASSALQAVMNVTPTAVLATLAQQAALIGSTVTAAAPAQAVPVAASLMRLLLQHVSDATPSAVAQAGAVLAGAVIAVVPPQAQEVATAVMQLIVQGFPNATPGWMGETAGLMVATLSQASPEQTDAIIAGIAAATGISVADLEAGISRYAGQGDEFARQIADINTLAAGASQRGSGAADTVAAGRALVNSVTPPPPPLVGPQGGMGRGGTSIVIGSNAEANNSTSIVITQFDAGLVHQLTADIEAAQAAQTSVQFSVETTPNGSTVRPDVVVPRVLPSEYVVSPAR